MHGDFFRVLVAALFSRAMFEVCRFGFDEAKSAWERYFWYGAAVFSIVGVLALLLASLLPSMVGSDP